MSEYRTSVDKNGIELTPAWRTIRTWECDMTSPFLLLYRCKATNNMRYNVVISFRIMVNNKVFMQTGYNVSWDAHYGSFNLFHVGSLNAGDTVLIQAKGNSTEGMPDYAAVIPYEGSEHESLIAIAIPGYWYTSPKLMA